MRRKSYLTAEDSPVASGWLRRGITVEHIANALACTPKAVERAARSAPSDAPTQAEIAILAAEIRSGWPPKELDKRQSWASDLVLFEQSRRVAG